MSTSKKLPTRRDRREAEGYLTDLFTNTHGIISELEYAVAEKLIDAAVEVKVQRATDRLVLYFDLNEETGALPPATTDADGVDNGGEREADGHPLDNKLTLAEGGLSEFRKGGNDSPAGVGG